MYVCVCVYLSLSLYIYIYMYSSLSLYIYIYIYIDNTRMYHRLHVCVILPPPGTHVANTKEIYKFVLLQEEGIAKGVLYYIYVVVLY